MNKKNTISLLLFCVVYILIFHSFFSGLFSVAPNFEQLSSKGILEKRNLLDEKKKQHEYLDSILSLGVVDSKVFENKLLGFINHQTDSLGVKLLEFTDISSHIVSDSSNQKVFKIRFQAPYFESLTLINQMEYKFPFSSLEHLSMIKYKPRRSRAVLHTEIIFLK